MSAVAPVEVAEALDKAADLFTKKGWVWVQGNLGDEYFHRACLLGAINYVTTGHTAGFGRFDTFLSQELRMAAKNAVQAELPARTIPVWNDTRVLWPRRQVIRKLRKTARKLRKRQARLDDLSATR